MNERTAEYKSYIECFLKDWYARFHAEPQRKLFDAILAEDAETHLLGIHTRHLEYILLCHPRVTRARRNPAMRLHHRNDTTC